MYIIFFFDCPKYDEERNRLFFHQILMLDLKIPVTLELLLFGDGNTTFDVNTAVFKLVTLSNLRDLAKFLLTLATYLIHVHNSIIHVLMLYPYCLSF